MPHFVYLLECRDGSYYCGYTTDIAKRIAMHNQKKGSRYTRSRTPVRLVYQKKFASKTKALQEEYRIKHLTRKQKEQLVQQNGRKKSRAMEKRN